ncbi:MAG: O-antigen ligase family protein [Methylotenera sp.]|nr:O-antigen ligase family protein [Oligoflexia bacterium]
MSLLEESKPKTQAFWVTLALSVYAVLTLGSMASMSIGIGILLVGLLIAMKPAGLFHAIRAEFKRPATRLYLFLTLALTLACAVSLIFAMIHPLSYNGKIPHVEFLKDMGKAWYFFWPLILVPALRVLSAEQRKTVLKSWLGAFTVLSAIGIIQYFTGWPRPQPIPGHAPYYHATLFLGHHLSVASIFIFPFFVALDLLRTRYFSRKFLLLAVVLGLLALFATYSRMLWIALPVGIFLWFLWILPRRWIIVGLISFSVGIFGLSQLNFIKNRMETSMGITERTTLWKINVEFFKARPWTGAGWHHNLELSGFYQEQTAVPGQVIFSGHAHSNFFEVIGSLGIFGLACWLAWSFYVVALPFRYRNTAEGWFARGMVCAWIVFQLNGLTQVNFWESKVIHSMMWMVSWALLWASENDERIKPVIFAEPATAPGPAAGGEA